MKFIEAITSIMRSQGMTKAALARKRNVRPQSINTLFTDQKRISLDVAASTAHAMDYRLVLMPYDAKIPADSYQIEG